MAVARSDEAVALWRAGADDIHHPQFARMVGEVTARRLNGSPVAAMLRSLGSPESVYGQVATSSTRFSTVSKLDTIGAGPGFAEIVARAGRRLPSQRRALRVDVWSAHSADSAVRACARGRRA